jgi:hypothetical protein
VTGPKPWTSGFCAVGNPPDSHARCNGATINRGEQLDCVCECHWEVFEAEIVEDDPEPRRGVPGFYPDIDEELYHRDPSSLSHSGAKTLLKAPALFRWEQKHPVYKKVFDFGTAAHKKVLGVGAEIRVIPSDILASNGATSTTEAKAFIAKARAEGAVALKAGEAKQIDNMANELANHSLAMELFAEGEAEVSAYAPDPETGIIRRCRFDWLAPTIAVDYKTAESADPAWFRRKAAEFGYHQQHPWYLDLAADLGHPAEAFVFIVQMKNPPYLVTAVELVHSAVARGRDLNRRALDLYRECVDTDTWPGFVPATEFARVDIPSWAYSDIEVEISE